MILVPMDTPGVKVLRPLPVFGFYGVPDRASEVVFENVRVPASNMLLGEGRGFEIAQGRLGPGRIHHCMRLIGLAERTLEKMCRRTQQRVAFGKPVAEQARDAGAHRRIAHHDRAGAAADAECRHMMDTVGNKAARAEIAMIKVAVPNMACQVIDWAIQAHGGGGTSNDFGLAQPMPRRACCAWPTAPTKCTASSLARWSCASTRSARIGTPMKSDLPEAPAEPPWYLPVADEVEVFEAAYQARLPVLLKGPTGCGKTRFVEHMAWRLYSGRRVAPLVTVACHEDLTATDLVGRYLLLGRRDACGSTGR